MKTAFILFLIASLTAYSTIANPLQPGAICFSVGIPNISDLFSTILPLVTYATLYNLTIPIDFH